MFQQSFSIGIKKTISLLIFGKNLSQNRENTLDDLLLKKCSGIRLVALAEVVRRSSYHRIQQSALFHEKRI